jgi:hypothetical protein
LEGAQDTPETHRDTQGDEIGGRPLSSASAHPARSMPDPYDFVDKQHSVL